jgi:3-hydroxyisobutyrate dehydrogenase-like beta-hydroxyacid dehydrogenase
MTAIGFIGTGSMGNPVAARLLAAGHPLTVHDLRRTATENLVEAGARLAASPADAGRSAEVVFLSLPSHHEVEQVCLGPDGLLAAMPVTSTLVDLTTVSISLVPRLAGAAAERGVAYLAAPVSQGVDNAKLGRLSIFVGGRREDHDRVRPVLDDIATQVIHTGDHASAIAAKLLTNYLWFINAVAIGEAMILGAAGGIDPLTLQQVILHSCGTSWVASHDMGSILAGTYDPTFTLALCQKDLRLIAEISAHLGVPTGLHPVVAATFAAAATQYGAGAPELSVVRHLEDASGIRLQA